MCVNRYMQKVSATLKADKPPNNLTARSTILPLKNIDVLLLTPVWQEETANGSA